MDVKVNDIIVTKKPHPCQNSEFLVLRIGADFKIRCTKCGREVMVPRAKIEKNIKKIVDIKVINMYNNLCATKKSEKN